MIIVGELINSSRKAIKEAIDKGDIEYIKKIAVDQEEAGATYIDVNAGTFVGTEIEHLKWMISSRYTMLYRFSRSKSFRSCFKST